MLPKFRAWDEKTKEYFHVTELWNSGTDPDNFEFDGWTDNFGSKGRLKDIVIEQYTGLKDINGKEIYVGDIVKYHNLDDKYQYLPIVWLDQDCLVSAGGYRIDIVARRCEVVGNDHESPELLEAQHG